MSVTEATEQTATLLRLKRWGKSMVPTASQHPGHVGCSQHGEKGGTRRRWWQGKLYGITGTVVMHVDMYARYLQLDGYKHHIAVLYQDRLWAALKMCLKQLCLRISICNTWTLNSTHHNLLTFACRRFCLCVLPSSTKGICIVVCRTQRSDFFPASKSTLAVQKVPFHVFTVSIPNSPRSVFGLAEALNETDDAPFSRILLPRLLTDTACTALRDAIVLH